VTAQAKKDDADRLGSKADVSAKWALQIKNFFSGRRKYLEAADRPKEDPAEKAAMEEIAREEAELQKLRLEVMGQQKAVLAQQTAQDGDQSVVASDIFAARQDL
jgi:hypothetical protein